MKKFRLSHLTAAAVVAALYAVLTVSLGFMSYLPVQLRVAEALTVLPFFSPYMIAGVSIGCLIANLFSPTVWWIDVLFGTMATLIGAVGTWALSKKNLRFLAPLPPVLANTVIVGTMLTVLSGVPSSLWINGLTVFLGEAVSCYGFGLPLLLLLEKYKKNIWK